jgi:molybdopterin synthase sulfur carrier subunit
VTVADLADWLARRHPIFADRDRLRVAVDQVMARFDTKIASAGEIAFFPPVTGG